MSLIPTEVRNKAFEIAHTFTVERDGEQFILKFLDPWGNVNRRIRYKHTKSLIRKIASESASRACRGKLWESERTTAWAGRGCVPPGCPVVKEFEERWSAINKALYKVMVEAVTYAYKDVLR